MNYYETALEYLRSMPESDQEEWLEALRDTTQEQLHDTLLNVRRGIMVRGIDLYRLAFYILWVDRMRGV